jgi:menaquinone-dependent protoporphyrinogen oxidase
VKVLFAYRTKYGCTETCARLIADRLDGQAALVDLAHTRNPDLSSAEVVVIAGSIYGGRIQRDIGAFCERHRELLLGKEVALFICCLFRDEQAEAQLAASFPQWLTAHAFARSWLGGELRLERLTPVDRILVRSVPGAGTNVSLLRRDAIEEMAGRIKALLPGPSADSGGKVGRSPKP